MIEAVKYDYENSRLKDLFFKKSNIITVNEAVESLYYDLFTTYEASNAVKDTELERKLKKIV